MASRKNAKPEESAVPSWRRDGVLVPDGARFYRALVENAGDIVTLLDRHSTIIYQSPAIKEVLGYGPEPFVGMSVFDGVHREDRDRLEKRFQECARSPGWASMETFRLPHRDGSWRWMEARTKNLLDDPDVGAILCISRDVTEARRLEHQLHEAERLARFGHWRWTKGAPSPVWSEGFAKILDRAMISLPTGGDWHSDIVHPEDRNELLSKFLDAFEAQETVLCVTRFLAGDGTYRHIKIHAYAEPDARNEIGALVGLAEDVTQEMLAREALQRSEAKYRLIAEQASDIIHHIAPDSSLLYMSPSVEGVLGYTPDDFMKLKGAGERVHPDDLARLSAGYREFVHERDMLRLEYRFRHKAGHYVWLETTMRAVREADGTLKEIIGMTRDMSERKKHEIDLMDARERAEAANRTKSRFLANMSHELRTPLNAIIGFSDMLKLEMFGKLGNARYLEYAQLINESGGLLLDLISDILDMSKIEAGKYELHCEPVKAEEIVEQALKLVSGRAEEGGLTTLVRISPEAANLPLIADERALKQILINLLSNAVKFTPRGGQIVVCAEAVDGGIRFRVEDTGRGIAKDHIPRLARAFEQVSSDAELSKQGTGLGLALVRSLTELHGGSILIESELGKGTCVSVNLPIVATRTMSANAAD
ncbi:MAG: PAS domain-containing protein [Parvibaculum sp.]|uniref:PAS domain-containing protein n=1 Tax=Parvibaculum sp. TaxID=2024848 RepID=UPI0025CD3AD6|nr:PAS domain-containing protein [Parvibaculum sp.]MCE9648682.1 PAS domain-containing protein [Parvibaculum sp.]